jgi:hypothetical protein
MPARNFRLLKLFTGFLLLHCCTFIGAILAQDDDGSEQMLPTATAAGAEITINRVIEIGKLQF